MNLAVLKKIRVVISILFFVSIGIIFLDYRNLVPAQIINAVLFLQFVPSILKFLTVFSLVSAGGFFIVLLLTVLFGRVYCSTICPLGTMQDVIIFISKKLKIKKFFRFTNEKKISRYSILVLCLAFIPIGGLLLLNLLDPYSNFGRICTNLVKPGVVWANNVISAIMENYQNYTLYPVEQKGVVLAVLVVPVVMLLLAGWFSLKYGRLYCNSVCPVGTLLGLVSKFSLFKIVIEENSCKGCGKCELACKSSCINKKTHEVDFGRCVGCMNCFSSCPDDAIKYKFAFGGKKEKSLPVTEKVDFNKRNFIISTSIYTLGVIGFANAQKNSNGQPGINAVYRKNAVSPPGSKSISHFTLRCTACHLCVSQCPTKVLQPSFLEYGFTGMMQPHLDYSKGFCNFDCNLCSTVCPNGAILPVLVENKKLVQLGVAKFVKENCVVHVKHTDCGACSEHCPTKAVNMVQQPNGLFLPKVNEELCIGCGACEHACPTKPYKAIYIEGNAIHKTAKKNIPKAEPVQAEKPADRKADGKQSKKKEAPAEDFPF